MRHLALILSFVLLAPVVGQLAVASSVEAKDKKSKPDKLPEGYEITRVALLGMANTANDVEAEEMLLYLTQAIFGTEAFQFRSVDGFAKDAELAGVKEAYDKLYGGWMSHRVADPKLLGEVCAATKSDAIMGMEVTTWNQYKLQATEEGTSYTNVGVKLTLVAADGVVVWESSSLRKFESQPYYPDWNNRADQTGINQTTSQSAIPDAPKFIRVAPEVAEEAVKKMPRMPEDKPEKSDDEK